MADSPLPSRIRTLQEVRQWFFDQGLTVTEWSRQHGFRADCVYALLAGRTQGRRGHAHRAALALGLKRSAHAVETAEAGPRVSASPRTLTSEEAPMSAL